jgi:hypothetical protein
MYPATVEILITKGRFEPAVAMAVAEALDMTLQNAQLVTVPILDARLAATEANLNARLAATEANLNARFAAAEANINARFAAAEATTNSRFASVEIRLAEFGGEVKLLEERMKRRELRYILCTAAIVFGNSHLGEVVSFIANLFRTLPN